MTMTFEQATTTELRALVDFARKMVVKAQEVADAAETIALADAGETFTVAGRAARDWEQVIAYVQPGTGTIELNRRSHWVARAVGDPAATLGVDTSSLSIWTMTGTSTWLNTATGQVVTLARDDWTILEVPAGALFIDPERGRMMIPSQMWHDRVTGEFSLVGPGSGSEFTGGAGAVPDRPAGLSDIIPSPQEYVNARLLLASGGLTGPERTALEDAVASFVAPGPWEDVRQPLYATDTAGRLVLDPESGMPLRNPLRVVDVAFRGELNLYYRRLVRDDGVDPFISRTAEQFQVISWKPVANLSASDARRFVALHTECSRVFKAAFYNQAMEDEPLYFGYCRTFIAWMTITRMMNEKMQGLTDVDRMSGPEVTNLLYSFGIYQFDDMPVSYRRRLAKNLERILSVKGTTQAFRDILSVFGMSRDVKIWKHYMVRYFPFRTPTVTFPRRSEPGEQLAVTLSGGVRLIAANGAGHDATLADLAEQLRQTGFFLSVLEKGGGLVLNLQRGESDEVVMPTEIAVLSADGSVLGLGTVELGGAAYSLPEVGFHRVGIDDPVAETTIGQIDLSYLADFDEFVSRDTTWETTREQAREQAFSVLQTKYFSMSAALDTSQNAMQLAMLWGALQDAETRGRSGSLLLPGASELPGVVSANLFEAFVAILTLTLWRFGVDDLVPHGESGVSTILQARTDGSAFAGEGTLLPYSTTLQRVTSVVEQLTPPTLGRIASANSAISEAILGSLDASTLGTETYAYDGLTGGESTRAQPREAALRRMWDFKFVSALQTQAFGAHEHYIEWLENSNAPLAAWVRDMDLSGSHVDGVIALTNLIEEAVDSDALNLFSTFGMSDVILTYVERLVRFFKAYTTDLREMSIFMLIDRPATERLRLMNLLAGVTVSFERFDGVTMTDFAASVARMLMRDDAELEDELLKTFGAFTKQDIADLLDSSSRRVWDLRVDPAAALRDAVAVRTIHNVRDAVTVRTRSAPLGSVALHPARPLRVPTQGLADRAVVRSTENNQQ